MGPDHFYKIRDEFSNYAQKSRIRKILDNLNIKSPYFLVHMARGGKK
jgi:hypothetical protein